MNRRALLLSLSLAAAAALAACNKGGSGTNFRLAEPSSVAVGRAYGSRHAGLWPYGFVANSAHNELIPFDAVEDAAIQAPFLLRPLSIPVLDPRPALVAAADFQPPALPPGSTEDNRRPSLVVAVSSGSSQLQLIRTWSDDTFRDPGLADDAPVELGGPVLALVATPMVDGTGAVVPDHVRVIAALADQQLAVVEYEWKENAADPSASRPVIFAQSEPQALGFQPLSLATDPSVVVDSTSNPPTVALRNPRFLYAASMDHIPTPTSTALGVAQIDMAAPVTAWAGSAVALDAGAPTRLVAGFTLQERSAAASGAYDQLSTPDAPATDSSAAFEQTADDPPKPVFRRRVYAWIDPSSCGPTTDRPCGIAVLDADTRGLAHAGFLGGQDPFPITVPSRPIALIAGRPPLFPPTDQGTSVPAESATLMRIRAVNDRVTTGVLAIPCENGRVYYADLARWEVPSAEYEVNAAGSATGVSSVTPAPTTSRRLGFYEPSNIVQGDLANGYSQRARWIGDASAASYIQTTPGFTPTDTWTVTYQGYLPEFASSRVADVADAGGGLLRVSFQAHLPGSAGLSQVVNVYDPALGVRLGDVVEIWTGTTADDPAQLERTPPVRTPICPDTTTTDGKGLTVQPIEGRVESFVVPDADHPGGSLVIKQPPGDCVRILEGRTVVCEDKTHGPWTSKPGCWAALPHLNGKSIVAAQGVSSLQVRIRARDRDPAGPVLADPDADAEFIVVGAATGYVGRARVRPGAEAAPLLANGLAAHDFVVQSADEASLTATCSSTLPFPYPASGGPVPECDASCRTACESAAIARRVRRTHLASVSCHEPSGGKTHCEIFYPQFQRPVSTDPLVPASTLPFPPPVGPTLAFSIGLQCQKASATAQTGCVPNQDTLSPNAVIRNARVTFTTRSGWAPAALSGGGANGGPPTQPNGGVYFDRTGGTQAEADLWNRRGERYRFFVPYVNNVVLDVSPALGETKVLR